MTFAPDDLKAVQQYCHDQTGQDWASLGITHSTPQGGGYHEGRDLLAEAGRAPGPQYPQSDYSYAESNRDLAGMSNAASAFDLGGNFPRFREITLAVVAACARGDNRCRDVREVIYTPDGRTVKRWDRLGKRAGGDDSHLSHTHVSFFRDSEGRRGGDDNFLGLLRSLFAGTPPAPASSPAPVLSGTDLPGTRQLSLTNPHMRGVDVGFVQKFIGAARCGPADGDFGEHTKAGVVWYQHMRGLAADGIVGPATWAQMGVHR